MNKSFTLALTALTVVIVATVAWTWNSESDTSLTSPTNTDVTHPNPDSASGSPWTQGAHAPGISPQDLIKHVRTSENGQLAVSAATLPVLDAFLAAHAGEAPEAIGARFKATLPSEMGTTALNQAEELMTRYANYQTASVEADKDNPSAPNVNPELASVLKLHKAITLREHHLGSEFHQSLFGAEEQRQRHELERQQIESTPGISAEQKAELIRKIGQNGAAP